ncbi:MAG: hypothetical protein UW24_C0011G0024 [Parcubacteria group bacterium GW2011_GWA2_44_12]|nr:MAG: hypothetical protein UW24_C0011G0024 [Parcubacteria group bacterium GW2011_GWA2_44_12]
MIFAHIAKDKRGTSLIETVVSLALFSFLIAIVNVAFNNLLSSSLHSKQNLSIVSIANEQMEIARNLPYASIGTDTGEGPAYGILNSSQVIIKDNVRYTVKIAVNAIDDPFDEKSFDESGSDLIPFDYKQITLEVNCEGCQEKNKIVLSSVVSPKLQEQHGVTGTLKVSVISAAGTPVDGAEVKMTNNSAATPSTTTKITPPNGRVDFLGLTPAVNAYRIEVSKAGFSSAQTYPLADTPFTPTHPDITIVADTVVTETLKIDQLSTLTIRTTTAACGTAPAGTITFKVFNDDKIGTNPDTFQYQRDDIQLSTDGNITIPNIRWGIYSISLAGNDYSITSTLPNLPVTLPPGANNEVTLVLEKASSPGKDILCRPHGKGANFKHFSQLMKLRPDIGRALRLQRTLLAPFQFINHAHRVNIYRKGSWNPPPLTPALLLISSHLNGTHKTNQTWETTFIP